MSRVTLRDIAQHVGVDRSTVSRVLSNKAAEGGISEELARRILSIAEQLNYVPNSSARAIKMGRFSCAALLMSTVAGRSYFPSLLLDGLHDGLAEYDMHLTVAKVPDEKFDADGYVPKILRALMADGLLINYTHHLPSHLVEMVDERQIPAVWLNTRRQSDCVYPLNREAARAVTERLLTMGHRRIAYVDLCVGRDELDGCHISVSERLLGYADAMRAAGREPWEVRTPRACTSLDEEEPVLAELLGRPDRPTAIVGYFMVFMPALLRAAAAAGLRVPQDLSVATFAGHDYRAQGLMTSAMLEPHHAMGREGVRMLRAKIDAPARPLPPSRLDFDWFDMGTCAPPPPQALARTYRWRG
jgi:LacI family transcriptional regulator